MPVRGVFVLFTRYFVRGFFCFINLDGICFSVDSLSVDPVIYLSHHALDLV